MSDSTRRTVRTVVQLVLGLAAGMPVILSAAGIPQTAAGVGVVLAVSTVITRVMSSPMAEALLPTWLRAEPTVTAHVRLKLDRPAFELELREALEKAQDGGGA